MFKPFVKTVISIALVTMLAGCGSSATTAPIPPTAATVSPTTIPVLPTNEPLPMIAERLIDECAGAMGGVEKIEALETLRSTQRFPDHGGLVRYEIKRPNRVRMGDQLVFDGKRASWLTGELVPQEEWKDFEIDIAWYIPAFFDYPAEYMGTEVVNGIETHILQVPLPMGATMTYNLDAQTYLVYRASARFTIDDKEFDPERIYSDYRLQDGILYPHAFTYEGRTGVFTATIETLEFNVPLEDERFAVPITPGMNADGSAAADVLPITPDNAADVELLRTIDGHQGKVWNVAFSGDGAYLASADRDSISVWEVASGQEAFALGIRELDLNSFTFSPDSRLLATGQTIWDVESQQVVHSLDALGYYFHPAFSPDGAWLAVSGGQPIKLWDVASGQVVRTFEAQADNDSFTIVFSPDGTLLADSGHDGRIRLWDVASGQVARTLAHGTQNDVHDIAFSPDGKLLVSVGTDYTVRLWDVASGQMLHTMWHSDGLYGVAFSPDGSLVAAASCDRTVKLWDVASGRMVSSLRHGDEVTSVAFSPDGSLLASGAYDRKVYLWGIPR